MIDSNGNMVNSDGRALYYFVNDGGNAISTCYGGCSNIWIPLSDENIQVQGDLVRNDFSTILREDGRQIAYKRWPLYYHSGDVPGSAYGDGKDGLWFVVKPKGSPFS